MSRLTPYNFERFIHRFGVPAVVINEPEEPRELEIDRDGMPLIRPDTTRLYASGRLYSVPTDLLNWAVQCNPAILYRIDNQYFPPKYLPKICP